MKSLFFVLILLSATCFAQLDSLDRVELRDSKIFTGKVIKVTSNIVEFRESVTNLLHEFNKSEIKDMKLSNGVTVTFDDKTTAPNQQNITGSSRTDTRTQGQAVGSEKTQTGNQAAGSGRTQTQDKGQTENKVQQGQNTPSTPAPADDSSSKMDTSMIIMLAAGGLVALLLIGALIF